MGEVFSYISDEVLFLHTTVVSSAVCSESVYHRRLSLEVLLYLEGFDQYFLFV